MDFFYLEFFSLISLSQILSDDSLASKPTLSLTLSDHQEAVSPEFLRCFLWSSIKKRPSILYLENFEFYMYLKLAHSSDVTLSSSRWSLSLMPDYAWRNLTM